MQQTPEQLFNSVCAKAQTINPDFKGGYDAAIETILEHATASKDEFRSIPASIHYNCFTYQIEGKIYFGCLYDGILKGEYTIITPQGEAVILAFEQAEYTKPLTEKLLEPVAILKGVGVFDLPDHLVDTLISAELVNKCKENEQPRFVFGERHADGITYTIDGELRAWRYANYHTRQTSECFDVDKDGNAVWVIIQ